MPDKQYIHGFEGLDRKLAQLSNPRDQRKVIRAALTSATTPIVKSARQNAPHGAAGHKTYKGRIVAPGFLSRSIKRKTRIVGQSIITYIGTDKEAFYGQFFELGTRFLTRQPWLVPALESNRAEAIRRFKEKMLQHIKKIARQR